MDNKNDNKRKLILSIIGSILLISIVLGISFSFYKAGVNKIKETETVISVGGPGSIECGDLGVMNCEGIVPGDQCTKEITYKNIGHKAVDVSIYMGNVTNQFSSELNDLVYRLYDKDTNELLIPETPVPASYGGKTYLLPNVTIPAGATKTFKFIVDYKYLPNQDQSGYENSVFSASFCGTPETMKCDNQCNGTCPKVNDYISQPNDPECPETVTRVTMVDSTHNTYCTMVEDNPGCPKDDKTDPDNTPVDETKEDCERRLANEMLYGQEVAIHHDIYFADQVLYSQGKNERYVTYCTPWKEGTRKGIRYCTESDGEGKCDWKEDITTCNYRNIMDIFGKINLDYQTRTEFFMDTSWNENGVTTNNWHIKEFCENPGDKSTYTNNRYTGEYYCQSGGKLHDWYHATTSSANDINIASICSNLHPTLAKGKYVYMVPTKDTFDVTLNGLSGSVDPQELTLWRIIDINENGTYDMVSEYMSTGEISVLGKQGYLNYVGELKKIANLYRNDSLTVDARIFGYNNQTDYVTKELTIEIGTQQQYDVTYSGGNINMCQRRYPNPDDLETCQRSSRQMYEIENGAAGDNLYLKDYKDLVDVYGTAATRKVNVNNATGSYLISSRYAQNNAVWTYMRIDNSPQYAYDVSYAVYGRTSNNDPGTDYYPAGSSIRPIVTLKSTITKISGTGTKADPYILK